jgi:hypothetical protein
MSKRYLIPVLAVGLLALCGWLFTQQARPAAEAPEAASGRYAVSPAGDTAVLLETTSGKTWMLHHSVDGTRSVWLPARRLDHDDEARQWVEKEKKLQIELAELEKQARFENEKRLRAEMDALEKERRRLLIEGVPGGKPKP